jgi:DNA-binding XRE family transcriptional regulator
MTAAEFRHAREKVFGLTQSEWGRRLGISRVQVAKIEGGVHPVSPTLALLVGAYLNHGIDKSPGARYPRNTD